MPADTDNFRDYLIDEFVQDYQENRLPRREALLKLAGLTGSVAAAAALLAGCAPAAPAPTLAPTPTLAPVPTPSPTAGAAAGGGSTPASAIVGPGVDPNDPAIQVQDVQFQGPASTILAYLARPRGNGPFPAVLICHENRGLIEPTQDIARRYAKAGYVGLAVDLLSRDGGTAKVEATQVPGILGNRPAAQHVEDFQAGIKYLQDQAFVKKGGLGMTGFCFGGGVTWRVILKSPEIKAAVPYYGPLPPEDEQANIKNIQAAVLGIYGGQDPRITSDSEKWEPLMKQNGKIFERIVYPDAMHAFFNNTSDRYNAAAAMDAWPKTIAWFDKYIKA